MQERERERECINIISRTVYRIIKYVYGTKVLGTKHDLWQIFRSRLVVLRC